MENVLTSGLRALGRQLRQPRNIMLVNDAAAWIDELEGKLHAAEVERDAANAQLRIQNTKLDQAEDYIENLEGGS